MRFSGPGMPYEGLVQITNGHPQWTGKVRLVHELVEEPLRWRKPQRIFVNSMSDLFHEDVPFDFIDEVVHTMARSARHTYQVLTKRPARMLEYFETRAKLGVGPDGKGPERGLKYFGSAAYRWPLPNLQLGVSVEDQPRADERIPLLLQTPAAVRFLSCEPLLGPVDLEGPCRRGRELGLISVGAPREAAGRLAGTFSRLDGLGWVIVGGESGPGARPCDLLWVESLIGQCRAAGVPVFVKQLGKRPVRRMYDRSNAYLDVPVLLQHPKGGDWDEWSESLQVREFPAAPKSPEKEPAAA